MQQYCLEEYRVSDLASFSDNQWKQFSCDLVWYAKGLGLQVADAEDIVQDVLRDGFRLLRKPSWLARSAHKGLKPYFFRALKNRRNRLFERRLRRNDATLSEGTDQQDLRAKVREPNLEWVEAAFNSLDERERAAVEFRAQGYGAMTMFAEGDPRLRNAIYQRKCRAKRTLFCAALAAGSRIRGVEEKPNVSPGRGARVQQQN